MLVYNVGTQKFETPLKWGDVRNNQNPAKSYVIEVERVYALYMKTIDPN